MIAIRMESIQAIEDYTFKFDKPGLIQFVGDNSNGKSILAKVTARIVFQQLKYDDRRMPIITRGKEQGRITYMWNKKALMVTIAQSVHNTYYTLLREDGTSISRYVSDQGIDVMLREFGFVVYGKNEVCLQVCETFGAMPFLNTRDELNLEIVDGVITDIPSQNFVLSYQTTYKTANDKLKIINSEINSRKYRLNMLHPVPINGIDDLINRTGLLIQINDKLPLFHEIDLEPYPKMNFNLPMLRELEYMPLVNFELPELRSIYNFDYDFEKLRKSKLELDRYINGICPTCGKRVIGGTINA